MGTITPARGLIATSIWKGTLPTEVRHKVHWALPDAETDTRGTMDMSEDDRMGNGDTGIHTDLWGGQDHHAGDNTEEANDEVDNKECHTVPIKRTRSEGNKDDRIAMESLKTGKWLTCTVIDRQMKSLAAVDPTTEYMPTSFFTRLYDMDTQKYTLHPVLHEVHGPELLQREYIFIPVARPGHWASLWIDTARRTIKYLDSYYQGGASYAKAMKAYLEDFENTLGTTDARPWMCIETTHRRSHEDATRVYVPRQIGSDDCGVYVCMFADLIGQRRPISEAEQGWIEKAREALRKQLTEKRHHRTTPDPLPMQQDDYTAFTGTGGTEEVRQPEMGESQTDPRRSGREKRTRGYQPEQNTDEHTNNEKLGVYAVEGMGYGLFAKQEFSIKDRIICVYHGKKISRKKAYAKQNKSNYIVEVMNHYRLPLCIDGWDETRGICFNKGGYANDAIGWEGEQGRWNAEFIVDDYDSSKIILRPLRDIAKGEQIYAWYGPQYWCNPQHPVELMAKAIITYGVNIETSTGAPGSQGAWRKLPAAILYKLREILRQLGYTAPAQPTPYHAKQPTEQPTAPTGDELLIDYSAIPEDRGQTRRHTRARHTLEDIGEDKQRTQEDGTGIAPTNDTMEKNTQTPTRPSRPQHITDITTNDIGVIDLTGNRPLQDDKNTTAGSHAEHQESD